MDKLSQAICFATEAFDGMTRKCENFPAVFHSLEAAAVALTLTTETEAVIAAVLHDTVEDADVTIEEIEEKFGARVAALVASETENKRPDQSADETWRVRKQESIDLLSKTDDIGVKVLYLSDKLSNIRSLYRVRLKQGESMWENFHEKNPHSHYWYYKSVAENLSELSEYPAYTEYVDLINKTFEREIRNG